MATKRQHPKHPLAEVFGFPWDNQSPESIRHRQNQLCPFNNKVPSCTKDKVNEPLGVCSVFAEDGKTLAITCPVRFRERWIIAEDAAAFFFGSGKKWTSLTEVRIKDRDGQSAGNIDVVLVAYDTHGKLIDFGALEIQAVYISGNIRHPFEAYLRSTKSNLNWQSEENYPRPDYLSSSRKRLVPQLIYKGGILSSWKKKMAVVVHREFFDTLPKMKSCGERAAEVAWLVYDLAYNKVTQRYELVRHRTCYSKLNSILLKIATPKPGPLAEFTTVLQEKLDEQLSETTTTQPNLGDLLR